MIGIAGYGRLGRATEEMLPVLASQIYDPPQGHHGSLSDCDVIFVCTPTPASPSGHLLQGIDLIAQEAKDGCWIVIRSTVSPGTTDSLAGLYPNLNWAVVPDFRTDLELQAMGPVPFPILGANAPLGDFETLFAGARRMSWSEAEMVKVVTNCALATQVALANEFHELAEKIGANWESIRQGLLDGNRVGSMWNVTKERGFGGKCLPKDLEATIGCLEQMGVEPYILNAVKKANEIRFRSEVRVNG